MSTSAFAVDYGEEIPTDVIGIRQNISIEEAMTSDTFSIEMNNASNILSLLTDNVYWEYWGTKSLVINNGINQYAPIGYSQHVRNGTVLQTYHYTRTFVEVAGAWNGDSGRVWNTGCVIAHGYPCSDLIWKTGVQKVYYGTTS